MDLGLSGRVALVTGASRGIGRAIVETLLDEGATVAGIARSQQPRRGGTTDDRFHPYEADATDSEKLKRVVAEVADELGPIQILVNNVGGIQPPEMFEQLTESDWLAALKLNLMPAVTSATAVLPGMVEAGWGRIINISSEAALQPHPIFVPYAASKAALTNFTKSLSRVYGSKGVLVNTVSPAFIRNDLFDQILAQDVAANGGDEEDAIARLVAKFGANVVLGRPGRREEVAAAVAFLASEMASFITGEDLRVDGGSVLHT